MPPSRFLWECNEIFSNQTNRDWKGSGVFPLKNSIFLIFLFVKQINKLLSVSQLQKEFMEKPFASYYWSNSLRSIDIYFCGVRETPPEKAHNSLFLVRCLKLSKMKLGGEVWGDYAYNMSPMPMLSIAPSEVVWPSGNKIFEAISIMSVLCLH